MAYWLTGRQGAGKTTLAWAMRDNLRAHRTPVLILDGDDFRDYFPAGYSDEARREHILRMASVAALAEKQGITVIVACISPKKAWRDEARREFQESQLIYIPGGKLWKGTTYEEPDEDEIGCSSAP